MRRIRVTTAQGEVYYKDAKTDKRIDIPNRKSSLAAFFYVVAILTIFVAVIGALLSVSQSSSIHAQLTAITILILGVLFALLFIGIAAILNKVHSLSMNKNQQ